MEKDQIKERIISESIGLFMQFGMKSVTMDDIARHMGISKKTIYQNFKDKEEIVLSATERYLESELKVMESLKAVSENAVEHLYKITVCVRDRMKNTNNSVLYDLRKYYKAAWEKYTAYKNEVIFRHLLSTLQEGIEQGWFRSTINPEIMAYLRLGEIELSFNKEYFPDERFSLGEIHEQLFDHFTYGILSEKGLQQFETYKQQKVI
jgi:AcrR family transcriptional regulator